ncbi:hypothetical protein NLO93_23035 [Pseudomonas savastanoi]|uniref:hypothetical protein n=1 Tax=Pseudomonas savastanoi TaxID=29438 RepID=UPI00210DD137|nr:hypothetical protein [Pseudomonas savastanoi]MCQ3007924.1 hypothetical protein [Pseudomonas savastanoi]
MHTYYFRLSRTEDVADLCRISAEARLRYRTFPSLAVTTCNRNGLDLQSSSFSTGIDCVYSSQQTGIICE